VSVCLSFYASDGMNMKKKGEWRKCPPSFAVKLVMVLGKEKKLSLVFPSLCGWLCCAWEINWKC